MDQSAEQPKENGFKKWLFSVAAKKAAWAVGKFVTAILSSVVVQNALRKYGITVDPQVFLPTLSMAVIAALEFAHDAAKLKLGWAFL